MYTHVYKIIAKHSGKVLDIEHGSKSDCAHLIQHTWHDNDNQRFVCFELDNNLLALAALHSGRVLDVSHVSESNGAALIQHEWNGGFNQQFTFAGSVGEYAPITARHSNKVLDVAHAKKDDNVNIVQYDDHGGDNQRFMLAAVGEMPPRFSAGSIGARADIPRFKTWNDQLPAVTDRILVAETAVPYFMVTDDGLSIDRAIKMTPYYTLVREQYWRKDYQLEFSGFREETQRRSYKCGITKLHQQSMSHTIGVEINADFGLLVGFKANALLGKLTSSLTWTTSSTEQTCEEMEKEVQITYPAGPRCCIAGYTLVDRLSLFRANGMLVTEPWEVVNETERREDGFPDSSIITRMTRSIIPLKVAGVAGRG